MHLYETCELQTVNMLHASSDWVCVCVRVTKPIQNMLTKVRRGSEPEKETTWSNFLRPQNAKLF